MNKRIRYEDLNWRVITDDDNRHIYFEKSGEDVLGAKIWIPAGRGTRYALCQITDTELLAILWTLLDQYKE